MKQFKHIAIAIAALLAAGTWAGCKNEDTPATKAATDTTAAVKLLPIPTFNEDSAYSYVATQVAFGPRTPGSEGQRKCAAWMQTMLKASCDTVYRQETNVKGGNGKSLPCINLVGVINPKAAKRILLLTHWDSRPWADQDTKDKDKPILAADDSGSGVGVLLELAKQLKAGKLPSNIGIDILLTDVEDYGRSEWGEDSYCLGTQYWAKHPHIAGYKAEYGILLDMVGGRGAQFPLEGSSMKFAGEVQQKVWKAAATAGFTSYFLYAPGADITDDHIPVNMIAGIKTIDIISLTPDPNQPFPAHWHTHNDNMQVIDKSTLKAVGQTLLQNIYEEQAGAN